MARIYLILITVFAMSMILGQSQAYNLSQNGRVYWNVTIQNASELAIYYNVSSRAALTLMPASRFGAYLNGSASGALYNSSISSSDVMVMNLSRGDYDIFVSAPYSNISYDLNFIQVPKGKLEYLNLNGVYHEKISLSNFSAVNLSWAANGPFRIDFPDGVNFTVQNSTFYVEPGWVRNYNRGNSYINFTAASPTK